MRALSTILFVIVATMWPVTTSFAWDTNDWQFLETIERANMRFFQNEKHGPYNLLNDTAYYNSTNNYPAYSSVAGIGFEMTAICLGHYRGWISYSNAYEQVLRNLQLFTGQLSTNPLVGERVNGWTWHTYWIDGTNAGTRYYMSDGLSLLDHSLFMAGCIFVAEYFKGTEAGNLAEELYEQTQWSWRADSDYTGFGYCENLLSIVECAAAPQYQKTSARSMWESLIEPEPRTLQFYFWEYPHAWVDFRFQWDGKGRNHAQIALDSILYQRQCAINLHNADPVTYDMIGSNVWGWTAAAASDGYRQLAPWGLWLGGTWYDENHASDSGSVTPIGLPPCMIYAGTETMAALKEIYQRFYVNGWNPAIGEMPVWSDVYGFINCFNKGVPWDSTKTNWFSVINAGIDYGPNVLMLENYKMGSTWRWFMQHPSIAAGMTTLGFGAPQHVTLATFSNQVNEFGMSFGYWQNDGYTSSASYVTASPTNAFVQDYAVRIAASGPNCGGWIDLNGSDQRGQAVLSFWIKGLTGQEGIDVGLKDVFGIENKIRLSDYIGMTPTNWTQVKIPLEAFCLTGNITNDVWLGNLALVSFAFTNVGGGGVDVDYLAFTPDTIAPVAPTNYFGIAQAGALTRITWDPSGAEHDVIGYHVWRRQDSTSGFTRVTSQLVPAYLGFFEDTSNAVIPGEEVRYAIQAFDNAEPQNASPFSLEKRTFGGRLDVDWNNGSNPNTLGGTNDGFWGAGATQAFSFVQALLPDGWMGWVRRASASSAGSGHYIDTADGDVADYWALSFYVKGNAGGEGLLIGLRDSSNQEVAVPLNAYLAGGTVTTNWSLAEIPLSDFSGVNFASLRNISFAHTNAGTFYVAQVGFLQGQRPVLGNNYFTEAENYALQYGSSTQDYKAAASGGQVLGQGWGDNGGEFADYEFFVGNDFVSPTLHVRYSCNAGNGRSLDVQWDGAKYANLVCTNTGGWGDTSNQFSWATAVLPSMSTGFHKLTFFANGYSNPVNVDCWYLTDAQSCFRECENFDSQVGSGGQDLKAGASGGAVLGQSWGVASNSEAVYSNVIAGVQTGAWLHAWYALGSSTGRVADVYVDGQRRARLVFAGTGGWGDRASHFDRVSAFIGALGAGTHVVRFAVPAGGHGVNLDCFYVGPDGPEGHALDSDSDGLSDRQEAVLGTSPTNADTDGDGISDGDELQFGRLGQVTDPLNADSDGDGVSDLEEAIAGTDPNSATSLFKCLEISATNLPAPGKIVRWPSVTGRVYSIYASTNLMISDFGILTSGVTATPPYNTYTDTLSSGAAGFYWINAHQ